MTTIETFFPDREDFESLFYQAEKLFSNGRDEMFLIGINTAYKLYGLKAAFTEADLTRLISLAPYW